MIDLKMDDEELEIQNEHRTLRVFFGNGVPEAFILENLPAGDCYVAHALETGIRNMPANYTFQVNSLADFRDKLRYAMRVVVSNG